MGFMEFLVSCGASVGRFGPINEYVAILEENILKWILLLVYLLRTHILCVPIIF